MTQTEFEERFPQFKPAGALIPLALAEAAERIDATAFGDAYALAVGYYAAHILATSPYGRSQRLVSDENSNVYLDEFNRIKRSRVVTMFVL